MAVTNTTVQDVRLDSVKPPEKLTSAFPESVQSFEQINRHLQELQRQFNSLAENYRLLKSRETVVEKVAETTVTTVTGAKGEKGDTGDTGATGAKGADGETENLENLFANILTDGANVLVGSDGNVLTGSL